MFKVTLKPTEDANTYAVFVANVRCGSTITSIESFDKLELEHQLPSVYYRYGLGVYFNEPVSDIDLEIFNVVNDIVDGLGYVL